MDLKQTGTVARIPVDENGRRRGFGFIRPDEGLEDIFFHATGMSSITTPFSAIKIGERVSFGVEPGPRSGQLRAVDVRVIDGADQ